MSSVTPALGLSYWGGVGFMLDTRQRKNFDRYEAISAKAHALADHYGCSLDCSRVEHGDWYQQHTFWFMFRFNAYTLDAATFAASDLARYVNRFKGIQPVDLKHAADWRGRPKCTLPREEPPCA